MYVCMYEKEGVVLVATSNRSPTELYLNGLNRQYFEPFTHRLQVECIVRHLDGAQDYRLAQAADLCKYMYVCMYECVKIIRSCRYRTVSVYLCMHVYM